MQHLTQEAYEKIKKNWWGVVVLVVIGLSTLLIWLDSRVSGFLYTLSILPAGLFAAAFYFYDQEREPLNLMANYFLLGILIIVPTAWLEIEVSKFVAGMGLPISDHIEAAFLVVAPIEEGMKLLAILALLPFLKDEFDEPVDGLVYGAMVGAGFAAWENLRYVYYPIRDPFDSTLYGVLRTLTAVPLHVLLGATMGHFIAMYKFTPDETRKRQYLALTFLVPFAIHGAYDTTVFATSPLGLWWVVLIAFTIVLIFATALLFKIIPEYADVEEQKRQRKKLRGSF